MSTFEELRARVAGDTALQERLEGADNAESFVAMVGDMARDLGFDLDNETIRQGIEASTAGAASTELSDDDLGDVGGAGTFTLTRVVFTRYTMACSNTTFNCSRTTMACAGGLR